MLFIYILLTTLHRIETLVQQAENMLETSEDLASLLPIVTKWTEFLSPFLESRPNPALGVMRPFAGGVFLVQSPHVERPKSPPSDLNGYSIPLRMAMYTARLAGNFTKGLEEDLQINILYLLGLTAQLVQDQIDLQEEPHLFTSSADPDVIAELQDFLQICNSGFGHIFDTASNWLDEFEVEKGTPSHVMHGLIVKLLRDTSTNTPRAFYASRSLAMLLQRLNNDHGWDSARGEAWLQKLDILKPDTANILGAISILIGLQDSLGTSRITNSLCNRLVSDVAGANAQSDKTTGLLVLLNTTLSIYDEGDIPVPQNRLIFAVKQILTWTNMLPTIDNHLSSEVCRALHRLLPSIRDVYGSHWETALTFCVSIWEFIDAKGISNEQIPIIGMSLKLYAILRNLKDANDDLEDALAFLNEKISRAMVRLLKIPRFNRKRSLDNLPLKYVDDQLSREMAKIPLNHIEDDLAEFYPLIVSDSPTVQSAAFDVLHRALPEAQQQISLDVVLENRGEYSSELGGPSLTIQMPDCPRNFFLSSLMRQRSILS